MASTEETIEDFTQEKIEDIDHDREPTAPLKLPSAKETLYTINPQGEDLSSMNMAKIMVNLEIASGIESVETVDPSSLSLAKKIPPFLEEPHQLALTMPMPRFGQQLEEFLNFNDLCYNTP